MTKDQIMQKIDQVNADIDSLCKNKADLEAKLVELNRPHLKHGDVVKDQHNYYFIWLKNRYGQLQMVSTYALWEPDKMQDHIEEDRDMIVGNIFDGFNPWS